MHGVGFFHLDLGIQLEVTIEVYLLVLEAVSTDFGFLLAGEALVETLLHFPLVCLLLVKEWYLVVSSGEALVVANEDAVQVRVASVHNFLCVWLCFWVLGTLLYIRKINFAVVGYETYLGCTRRKGCIVNPSIA